jgi:pimeloyl-ACP methyl ester carboxylesterase
MPPFTHHFRKPPFRARAWLGAGVAALGAMALANLLAARAAERRYPPRGRFLRDAGLSLHYLDQGTGGPPIVLLHGNGAMAEDFVASGLFGRLAARHRVIAFDRPGFGHSTRPRGRAWTPAAQAAVLLRGLRALGVERPVLVGHSWGVLAALSMALQAGREEVSGLVLLAGYALPSPRLDVLPPSLLALPGLGDVLNHTLMPPLNQLLAPALFRRIFAPRPVSPGFRAGFPTALALRPRSLRATAGDTALMIPGAAALAPHYDRLLMPVTIMAGTGDRMVDTDGQSAALHRRIPHSRFLPLQGAGHMFHHTHMAEVAAAIEDMAAAVAAAPA